MAKGKYQQWLEPDGLLLIEGWARDGLTEKQICKNMDISNSTLSEWKLKYPVISEALKRKKEIVDKEVENALLKSAMGFFYEEEVIVKVKDKEGNEHVTLKKVKRYEKPNSTAQIFWLKNRQKQSWNSNKDKLDEKEQDIRIKHSEIKLKQEEINTELIKANTELTKVKTDKLRGISDEIEDLEDLETRIYGDEN
ncbi:hypothetical protein HMPREF3188_00691 [Tissierellia bacterium KA00581]|jgi:hypothetical protein|nr:hypothetical protein HMPREF3188_00691 [Tissierellia bacterium KA00581]